MKISKKNLNHPSDHTDIIGPTYEKLTSFPKFSKRKYNISVPFHFCILFKSHKEIYINLMKSMQNIITRKEIQHSLLAPSSQTHLSNNTLIAISSQNH